ncbi:hypothetical protein BBJ28_00004887 [Nothophytophthora sp. Chile5]|nr:hypothetical protein BBJ28_00004887 [Nothophytophthora sp. Chile5]
MRVTDKRQQVAVAGSTAKVDAHSRSPATTPAAASKDDTRPRGEQKQAPVAARSRLTLERVLGVTALSNAMMAVNPVTGELAYAAGCIVVVYNLRRNRQVRYYRVDKSVACLCFSPSGQFLAIGEKGYLPAITIWDGTDGTLCAELQHHQYGIACMAFSRDGRFLLSAGLVHDQHLYAWELTLNGAPRRMKATAVGCALLEDKVLAADYCEAGNFFVTVGEKHFKHRDAVISAKTSATFTDVGCGYGACKLKTFAVTTDGTLCCFGASGIMERLVSLEATCGNSLSVTESYVAVGGSSAIVRLFDPSTLEYRATLPFPPAFGTANESPASTTAMNDLHPDEPRRYPAVIAVRITGSHVIALYSDRSIFIYDTANPEAVTVERSFLFHSGGIRDLQVVGQLRGVNAKGKLVYHGGDASPEAAAGTIPIGTFVTCSDDNTVRLWHLELHRRPVKSSRFDPSSGSVERPGYGPWKNPYSQEMLRVIYNDQEAEFANEHAIVLGGTCSHEFRNEVHPPAKSHQRMNGLRTVAVRLDQKQIAAGDREGNIMLASLPLGEPVVHIGAHSSEVQCLAYSGLGGETEADDARNFMASGGKDQLVHVYDCGKGHAVLSTLESHSAAVTAVAFTRNGKKLLSCGADKNVAISDINPEAKLMRSRLVPVAGGKVFDMVLASDSDSIVTACGNKLDIFSANTGKQIKTLHVGEQHHIALCPANCCVAMSGSLSERMVHVVDIVTGETLATGTGHGEAITAIKFTPDCRRLLSASGDGCIFVWRLSEEIQSEIKAKLPRVKETQGPAPAPPARTDSALMTPVLPPPAPPLSAPRSTHITDQNTTTAMVNDVDAEAKKPAIAAGRSEAKKSPRDWKGRGFAVPGPMADIPMDDWMRTRETAKPTIHVVDGGLSDQVIELETVEVKGNDGSIALSIDRSQTPGWARTVLPAAEAGHPAENPPLEEAAPHQNVFVGEKWSKRIAPSLSAKSKHEAVQAVEGRNNGGEQASRTTKSQLSSQREEDCTPLSAPSQAVEISDAEGTPPTQLEEDERVGLSVNILGNNTAISTSLALEREQLEKRKKQIDTAKAVAAMNTRLSQLGLLKFQHKSEPQQNPEIKSSLSPPKWQETARSAFDRVADSSSESSSGSSGVHDNKPDAASSLGGLTKMTGTIAQDCHPDIPIEMFESIEFPPPSATDAEAKVLPTEDPQPSTTEQRQNSRWQRNSAAASTDDLSRTVEFEYATSSSDADEDAVSGDLVDEALDAATNELTEADNSEVDNSELPKVKQRIANALDQSLSSMTIGFELPEQSTRFQPEKVGSINMASDETEKKLDMSLEQIVQERKAEATAAPASAPGKAKSTVKWQDLKDHMKAAGPVELATVMEWNGRSKRTHAIRVVAAAKGCGIVSYATEEAAQNAIATLNDTELGGRKIFVREDREAQPVDSVRPKRGFRVYVGNLSWNVKWQELKDHMKQVGTVVHADGCGLVEYATLVEATNAITQLNNTELEGRLIFVREDREPEGGSISKLAKRAAAPRGVGDGRQLYVGNVSSASCVCSPMSWVLKTRCVSGIYVGVQLPWDTNWQQLKDLFRTVGDVERADIAEFPDGRSRGFGIIRYTNPSHARVKHVVSICEECVKYQELCVPLIGDYQFDRKH